MRCVWRCRSAPVTLGEPKDAVVSGVSAKKFAQRTKNGPKTALDGVLGELFRAYTHVRPSRANFFAPKLLAARRDETVNTNAGSSARLRETRDAFARRNGIKNRCFCLAMVPSVSPKTERAPAKVMTVSHSCRPPRLVTVQAGSPKSCMQFDRTNFQQSQKTLKSQRCEFMV